MTEFSSDGPTPADDTTGSRKAAAGLPSRDSEPSAPGPVDGPAAEAAPTPPVDAPAAVVGGDRTEASHAAATTVTPDATPAPVPVDSSSPLVPVPDLDSYLAGWRDACSWGDVALAPLRLAFGAAALAGATGGGIDGAEVDALIAAVAELLSHHNPLDGNPVGLLDGAA